MKQSCLVFQALLRCVQRLPVLHAGSLSKSMHGEQGEAWFSKPFCFPLAEKPAHFSIAEGQKLGGEQPVTSCWPPVLSFQMPSREVIKTSPQAEPHLFQYNPPGKPGSCSVCTEASGYARPTDGPLLRGWGGQVTSCATFRAGQGAEVAYEAAFPSMEQLVPSVLQR